jgi:hypothetical protein
MQFVKGASSAKGMPLWMRYDFIPAFNLPVWYGKFRVFEGNWPFG